MESGDAGLCSPEPTEPTIVLTQEEAFLACSTRWYNTLRKYSFATEGVGLFSVALVGILANMLSIAVLCQRTMKSQITALLITLAIFDILFLLCTMPVFTAQSVNGFVDYLNECVYPTDTPVEFMTAKQMDIYSLCLPFLYGMTHVSKVGSVFSTLAVSLERYFAVCRPLWIRIRRCHPATYIVIVLVFAFGFNIPKFLEFEAVTNEENRTVLQPSALRTSEHYVVYYNFVTKTLLTELFPYVSLMFLNACIYREIRRSVKIQQAMRCTQSQKEEIKSANVVVGIVFLSILCHIWKIVPDLYEAITKIQGNSETIYKGSNNSMSINNFNETITNCSRLKQLEEEIPILEIEMIIDTSHLLVGVNSAANFFLYYLLRKNFRSATWRLLTCKKLPVPPGPGMVRHGGGGNNNCSTTSFINRNNDSTRVQRRATVAATRNPKTGEFQPQLGGNRSVSYSTQETNSFKGSRYLSAGDQTPRYLSPGDSTSRYLTVLESGPANGHCKRTYSESQSDIEVFIEEDGTLRATPTLSLKTRQCTGTSNRDRSIIQNELLKSKLIDVANHSPGPQTQLKESLSSVFNDSNDLKISTHTIKLFPIKPKNGEKINSKEKLRNIREETEPILSDVLCDKNGGRELKNGKCERLLDMAKHRKTSVRILERRYNQPKQSLSETDVEMATVLITFPAN